MSARDVYKSTNASDYVPPNNADDKTDKPKSIISVKERPVPLPTINQPMPIRTQAEIMRIWIAPWEDGDGDLHADGFVYSEVNQRRWNLGDRFNSPNQVIKPLTETYSNSRH
jgi:conjugal transfer pilus assembly protein TraV